MGALVGAISLGIVFETLVFLAFEQGYFYSERNSITDKVANLFRGHAPPGSQRPIIFIDIDDETYNNYLDRPAMLPRDQITKIAQVLTPPESENVEDLNPAAGRPLVVLFDIDFSAPSTPSKNDEDLQGALARLGGSIPVVLVESAYRADQEGKNGCRVGDQAPFDPSKKEGRNVNCGTASLHRADDHVIRKFPLWTLSCNGRSASITPSAPLLTAAFALHDPVARSQPGADPNPVARSQLEADLKVAVPSDCELRGDRYATVTLGGFANGTFDIDVREPMTPIDFAIPPSAGDSPTIDRSQWGNGNEQVPLLRRVSAETILRNAGSVAPTFFDGSIVIVGGSFSDSKDLHPTPVGEMPGALILANAINTLLAYQGPIAHASGFEHAVWSMILIAAIGLAFAYKIPGGEGRIGNDAMVAFVVWAIIIATAWIISPYWLDLALPITALSLKAKYHGILKFMQPRSSQ
ncbi:MAG: CHASE2 domain-containing protein [Geminicoccaceae bacterium]